MINDAVLLLLLVGSTGNHRVIKSTTSDKTIQSHTTSAYIYICNICPACVGNMVIHSGKSYERSILGLVAFHENVIGATAQREGSASQNWDLKGMGIVFPTC